MYGLPECVDLRFLVDREVQQVACGLYQVIFYFDRDVSISIEGQFSCSVPEGTFELKPGQIVEMGKTLGLLGRVVTDVRKTEVGELEIQFGKTARLILKDSNKELESFQITSPGTSFIV